MLKREYVRVTIDRTSRQAGKNTEWNRYDSEVKTFPTITEAKRFLDEHGYITQTKKPIYRDGVVGGPLKIGWVYSSKIKENWGVYYNQDWVTIEEVVESIQYLVL